MINYNDKKFKLISNSENGELSDDVIFHYKQNGTILNCSYKGGTILSGHLLGKVQQDGSIEIKYHQINKNGTLRAGSCFSKPEFKPDGKLRLLEKWQWEDEKEWGSTVLEEV